MIFIYGMLFAQNAGIKYDIQPILLLFFCLSVYAYVWHSSQQSNVTEFCYKHFIVIYKYKTDQIICVLNKINIKRISSFDLENIIYHLFVFDQYVVCDDCQFRLFFPKY